MITIAPKDCTTSGDIKLDGVSDVTVLARELGKANMEYTILGGTVNLNGGTNASTGNRYINIGAGTRVTGSDGLVLVAAESPCRWNVNSEGCGLYKLRFVGFVQVQNYSSNFTCEDVSVEHTFDGKTHASWKGKGGCVGAIQNWVAPGKTMRNVVYRRCTMSHSWHHGMGFHINGADQGSWWENILVEDCKFISCGSGVSGNDSAGTQDWSTGLDVDTGNIRNLTVRRCKFIDCFQSGGHTDGHWEGHEQKQFGVRFEDCYAERCGVRAMATLKPTELYCNGFYVQDAKLYRCKTVECGKAGIHAKAGSGDDTLEVVDCSDEGSRYGLVAEYNIVKALVENYTSIGAKRRAVQTTAANSKFINVQILNYNGTLKPVLLGKTERLEFIDAQSHLGALARYAAIGYNMTGSTFDFVFDKKMSMEGAIEVNPPSSVDYMKINLRVGEPVEPEEPETPPPPPYIPNHGSVKSIRVTYMDGMVEEFLAV